MNDRTTIGTSTLTLVETLCELAGPQNMLDDVRLGMSESGIARAVDGHDTDSIYDWLMEMVSYQGVSDAVATGYMQQHGRPRSIDVSIQRTTSSCHKLNSFWQYEGCGFHKGSRTCSEPEHIDHCPVPRLNLRNGRLNQSAFALRLFFRDVANDDIVSWIDSSLKAAATDAVRQGTRAQHMREALLGPLGQVHGISSKVTSMALASLLLGADAKRDLWLETGASMIAIDTLVHNWLHRTGVLREFEADHAYGPRCYGPGGCAELIERFSERIDAREFNPDYPAYFPRFVQKAIWRFCAQAGLDQCNGNRVDDRFPCTRADCELGDVCERLPLRLAQRLPAQDVEIP